MKISLSWNNSIFIPMRLWMPLIYAALLCACNTAPKYETIDGILEVPENREKRDSRTLKLVYKILKAKDTNARKAPIVYLQGGPGGATLIMEEFWKNHPLRNDRDIVLMDQRGTGESEANCTEFSYASFDLLRQDLDHEGEIRALEAIMSECKESMGQQGVDLAGYSSKENAADFEDLRKTLGYDQWNLFGASYGTRLGLTIMRDFPNSVRSSVLAGILAPETNLINESTQNFENSFISVLERCEKNKSCNDRYPNLKERLLKVLKKLQTNPLHFEYEDKPLVLNSQDALFLLYVSLYNRLSIGNIPLLIEALENGETKPLRSAVKRVENLYNLVNWPMHYSITAYEELPFYDAVAMDKTLKEHEIGFEPTSVLSGIKALSDWHSYRATDLESQEVVSAIPTLMASGGLDHATPPRNAKEALKHLKNGYELLFSDESHDLYNPCFFQIAEEFLIDPSQKPNTDCSSIRNPIEWNLSNPIQ